MLRKKVLFAISRLLQENKRITRASVAERMPGQDSPGTLLDEFVRRHVIEETNGDLRCKVQLFQRWLAERGHAQLALSFQEQEVFESLRQAEHAKYITGAEILDLVKKWGTYQGQLITEDKVRAWLNQFDGMRNQRLMFQILGAVRLYTPGRVREALREAHDSMLRDLTRVVQSARKGFDRKQKLRRHDILISYLDGPGKSGSAFAKLFADENGVYVDNIWEQMRVREYLNGGAGDERYKALVFVDDFVGTGGTAMSCLERMFGGLTDDSWKDRVKVFFLVVCGFQQGLDRVQDAIAAQGWPVQIHVCDTLTDRDQCFSSVSGVFADETEKSVARELVREKGERLEKNQPLGYGNLQMLVVFNDTCPNNSLPILWKQKAGWLPLFPRQ